MKRTPKPVFFIVAILVLALAFTSVFGVYSYYGDRADTIIRGAHDIRTGIDISGGVEATFAPADEKINATDDQVNAMKEVIVRRMIAQNITDYEAYTDVVNDQVIVRFPWKKGETNFDAKKAIEELGKTAMLEFYYDNRQDSVEELVHAVMTNEKMWGQDLTKIPGFEAATVANLTTIRAEGAHKAYASCL